MPQTLLAIFSMVVASMFAFNQQRSVLTTRINMISQEMALRSTGVAVDVMEEIGSMAFDDATKSGSITDPSLLTRLDVTERELEAGGIDDIDDFDGKELQRTRVKGAHNLNFVARPYVFYVAPDGETHVNFPTKHKKVTLAVHTPDFAFTDTVRVSQVFTCGSRCDW